MTKTKSYSKTSIFVKNCYEKEAKNYRHQSDPQVLNIDEVKSYISDLGEISKSFNHPIDVLDLCCGTGRYFHACHNVQSLTGLDFSSAMLSEAKNPIGLAKDSNFPIQLICASVNEIDTLFENNKFDFIYSIGALGEYAPIHIETLNKIYNLLKPSGMIYITTLEKEKSIKQILKRIIFAIKESIGLNDFSLVYTKHCLTQEELGLLIKKTNFKNVKIKRIPGGKAAHHVIIAQK